MTDEPEVTGTEMTGDALGRCFLTRRRSLDLYHRRKRSEGVSMVWLDVPLTQVQLQQSIALTSIDEGFDD